MRRGWAGQRTSSRATTSCSGDAPWETSWNKTNPDLHSSQPWESLYFSYAEGNTIVMENLLNLKRRGLRGVGSWGGVRALFWALGVFRLSKGKATHPYLCISPLFISAFHPNSLWSAAPPCTQVRLWKRESKLTPIEQQRHHPRAAEGQQQRGQFSSSTALQEPKIKHFVPG